MIISLELQPKGLSGLSPTQFFMILSKSPMEGKSGSLGWIEARMANTFHLINRWGSLGWLLAAGQCLCSNLLIQLFIPSLATDIPCGEVQK